MRRWLALIGLVVMACGATARAQTLTLAFHSGEAFGYGLHVTVKTSLAGAASTAIDLDVTAKEAVSVVSVDSSGNADVSVTTSDMTMKSTMGTITITTTGVPGRTVTMTIAPDGRLLSIDGQALAGTGFASLGDASGSFISAVLPSAAVKPGDTWSKTYDIANPAGTGGVHVTANSKYLRDETVGGVSTAVVETKSTATINLTVDLSKMIGPAGAVPGMPAEQGPLKGQAMPQTISVTGAGTSDTTTWIDASAHRVVKAHQTGSVQASLAFEMAAGSAAPMMVPSSIKATETLDLTPA